VEPTAPYSRVGADKGRGDMTDSAPGRIAWSATEACCLAGLLAVAFALRLIPVFVLPGILVADEVIQTVEQAHRMVYGSGFVPWEFLYGIRSWLLPGVFAGVMLAVRPLGEDPAVYLPALGILCALVSLAAPACAYLWARERYGRIPALLAGLLPAVWVDLVYFAPRTLSEPIAGHLLFAGMFLADRRRDPGVQHWPAVAGGALFGLAALLRFHLAPAIGLAVILACWRDRRVLWPMLAGGAVVMLLGGVLDAVTWTYPWQSIWLNYYLNVVHGISREFGVEPWYWYFAGMTMLWSGGAAVLWALGIVGARSAPALLLGALALLISHSFFEHKEYRFLYPAIAALVLCASIGIAHLARHASPARALGIGALIVAGSLMTTLSPIYREEIWEIGADDVAMIRWARNQPWVCGIAMADGFYGGESYLHRLIPRFYHDSPELLRPRVAGFNVLLYRRSVTLPPDLGFEPVICVGGKCAAKRPGVCEPMEPQRHIWRPPQLRDVEPWPRRFAPPLG
jgi:GPI mannosyltransferase 3